MSRRARSKRRPCMHCDELYSACMCAPRKRRRGRTHNDAHTFDSVGDMSRARAAPKIFWRERCGGAHLQRVRANSRSVSSTGAAPSSRCLATYSVAREGFDYSGAAAGRARHTRERSGALRGKHWPPQWPLRIIIWRAIPEPSLNVSAPRHCISLAAHHTSYTCTDVRLNAPLKHPAHFDASYTPPHHHHHHHHARHDAAPAPAAAAATAPPAAVRHRDRVSRRTAPPQRRLRRAAQSGRRARRAPRHHHHHHHHHDADSADSADSAYGSEKRSAAAAAVDTQCVGMALRFVLDARRVPRAVREQMAAGGCVKVVGSNDELGAWTVQGGVRMHTAARHALVADAMVRHTRVEFKLVLMRADGSARWERGRNRVVRGALGRRMELSTAWRE
eukprot:TRINITY_DN1727_c0_g1_i1.p1 TRINITY_DN1727_c0_g1~~TRINITY_DN1727_c0_g1_i1.p1  ORF type:complete len:390 (-),score=80.07 TRINITY_DN1727_c0_g1_i1:396-1565(-)